MSPAAAPVTVTVVYFGRRFVGPLIAERFRAGLAQAYPQGRVRVEGSVSQLAARLLWSRLRRRPVGPVVSVMVHPALAAVWPLVPRTQRHYVIHDATPHPGWRWWLIGGLDRRLAALSGTVVALSSYSAADWLRRAPAGQRVVVVPLPPMPGPPAEPHPVAELDGLGEPFVLVFGRAGRYKGMEELWPHLTAWWGGGGRTPGGGNPASRRAASRSTVVVAGVGARTELPAGAESEPWVRIVDRYLSEAEIDWLAERDSVLLLPYTSATQSGVLERFASGPAVPLGFAVGGLTEQLRSLHPICAVVPDDHRELLRRLDELLADAGLRAQLAVVKRVRARDLEQRFLDSLVALVGADPTSHSPGRAAVVRV